MWPTLWPTHDFTHVMAHDVAHVMAHDVAHVVAHDVDHVMAHNVTHVMAHDLAHVMAHPRWGAYAMAHDVAHVMAHDVAHVMAQNEAHVMAHDVAHVMAHDVAHVMAHPRCGPRYSPRCGLCWDSRFAHHLVRYLLLLTSPLILCNKLSLSKYVYVSQGIKTTTFSNNNIPGKWKLSRQKISSYIS